MDEYDEKLMQELRAALMEWWGAHRPVMYSLKDHIGNPTVNMTSGRAGEHRMAQVAAELAAKQLIHS